MENRIALYLNNEISFKNFFYAADISASFVVLRKSKWPFYSSEYMKPPPSVSELSILNDLCLDSFFLYIFIMLIENAMNAFESYFNKTDRCEFLKLTWCYQHCSAELSCTLNRKNCAFHVSQLCVLCFHFILYDGIMFSLLNRANCLLCIPRVSIHQMLILLLFNDADVNTVAEIEEKA